MFRKILKIILSDEQFHKIEDASKKWFYVCGQCGYARSVWDSGGIRFGATSQGKRIPGKCTACKQRTIFKVEKRA